MRKKLLLSGVLVVFLLFSLLPAPRGVLYGNALFRSIDTAALTYVDEALVRAGGSYVIARAINAVISVVQESELMVQPAGVGVTLALGQALDPLNDLVERFSWVMLACLASLGIQKVLVEISPWLSIQVLLVGSLVFFLASLWSPGRFAANFARLGKALLLVVLLVRFCVPAMAWINHAAYSAVLEQRYDETIHEVKRDLEVLQAAVPDEAVGAVSSPEMPAGWLEKTRQALSQAAEQSLSALDFRQRLEAIKRVTTGIFDQLIQLVVIFVLNTILLPLFFLWGLLWLGRLLFTPNFGQVAEKHMRERMSGQKR
ncbi:MAG: hypothetical protein SCI25_15220 [Desulfuromonadales bacterium]|nr:hypothetical protein [Desulfuromonadales bacterium]MDW7758814.1 hypothetical protein [Desulfuromonadales bacterium]